MSQQATAPRMADVARAAGVSTMTVSRAFRADASVSDKRRDEILRIAEEMGYIFDRSASELRTKRTGFVAVTVPSINNPNFADSVRGLTDTLAEWGLEVLLGYTNYRIDQEEQMVRQLLRRKPEALVVTGSTHTGAARQRLARAQIPIIECWDEPADPVGYSVGFSNPDVGAMMAEHLIGKGYRKIAFISGDTDFDTRGVARRKGFMTKLADAGLDATRLITAGWPPVGASHGADGARQIMRDYPDTEAVMCVADVAAFGALTEFQRVGKSVPHDIAVAGFGAFDVSAFSIPPITTIDPNAYEIGREAGLLIGSLLRGDADVHRPSHRAVAPMLVARAST